MCVYPAMAIIVCLVIAAFLQCSAGVGIVEKGPLVLRIGERLTLRCSFPQELDSVIFLHRNLQEKSTYDEASSHRHQQEWISPYQVLTIPSIQISDSGIYMCIGTSDLKSRFSTIKVNVISPAFKSKARCAPSQFECPGEEICIFNRYRCDKVKDCISGADEENCDFDCTGQYKCDSGQCISQEVVCDRFGSHDCRDGSDEQYCYTESPPQDSGQSHSRMVPEIDLFVGVFISLNVLAIFCGRLYCYVKRKSATNTLEGTEERKKEETSSFPLIPESPPPAYSPPPSVTEDSNASSLEDMKAITPSDNEEGGSFEMSSSDSWEKVAGYSSGNEELEATYVFV